MFSLLKRFIVTIVLAQWMYAEAVLFAPGAQPVLDTLTQFLKPPTHDKWIEVYNAFQQQRAQFSASGDSVSVAQVRSELFDSVEKLARHNAFGSIR